MINPTCVNLSMRVSRLRYYHWDPRLDSPSRHSFWLCCQLHNLLLLFPPQLPLVMHIMSANRFFLLSTSSHYRAFESAYAFASQKYVHKFHKEINDANKQSNVKPTLRTDSKKIFKTFNVADYVMVWIYPKWFLSKTVKILHVRNAEPFKILNKLNCNTYVINLLRNYDISCTFNVNDLVNYKDFNCSTLIVSLSLCHFLRAPHLVHSHILITL